MYSRDQDSEQVNNLYKQDHGLSQYYQDRDWEDQEEQLAGEYPFRHKSLSGLFDSDAAELAVSLLNDLAEINLDRIMSYRLAINELKNEDADLKILFSILIEDSSQYIAELDEIIAATGQELISGSANKGKICRRWLNISTSIALNRRKAILSGCEFCEQSALKEYGAVLERSALPAQIRILTSRQRESLRASYHKISELRNLQMLKEDYTRGRLRTTI